MRAERWLCVLAAAGALGCARPETSATTEGNVGPPGSSAAASPSSAGPTNATSPRAPTSAASGGAPPGREAPEAASASRAPEQPRCRVMSVSGEASLEGAPLRAGDALDGRRPVSLGAASTLHLVHTLSARQWTLGGPARLLACERGAEEIVLAFGSLRSEPGAGVRPGAEVWVGTPFGSLRYSDARAEVRVAADALSVRVSGGRVWFSPLAEASAERELAVGTATFPARAHRLASKAARDQCEREASAAAARAKELLSPSDRALGVRASEHVRARQSAHASCSGALAVLLADDSGAAGGPRDDETRAGYAELAGFDRLWRGVPAPSLPSRP